MKEAPRFFCDNCGAEVDFNLRSCPQCGRFFTSVRCPACGFSGEEALFKSGCPSCGYSAPGANRIKAGRDKAKTPSHPAGPLPLWVYVFSALALLAALISLVALVLK